MKLFLLFGVSLLLSFGVQAQISGTIFEDLNYGGGAGRPFSGPGAAVGAVPVGRLGAAGNLTGAATVELYNVGGLLVATTTTGNSTTSSLPGTALGTYSFTSGQTSLGGPFTVRVVNSTVRSTRTGSVSGLLPVQTWNGTSDRVGGENPALADAGTGTLNVTTLTSPLTGTAFQSLRRNVSAGTTGVDFGFNFSTIVNTNNAGQGSLRQFVLNANALGDEATLAQAGSYVSTAGTLTPLPAGRESSIFMIPNGNAPTGGGFLASGNGGPANALTNGRALITAASGAAVITLTSSLTNLDATTQTANIGNTNQGTAAGKVVGAYVGTVGTGPDGIAGTGDEYTMLGTNAPEVELVSGVPTASNGTGAPRTGFSLQGSSVTLRGFAVRRFNQADIATGGTNISDVLIENNLSGVDAVLGIVNPGGTNPSNEQTNRGINVGGTGTGITIQQNTIAFNRNGGLFLGSGNTMTNGLWQDNQLLSNGTAASTTSEGILLRSNYTNTVIRRNYVQMTRYGTTGDQGIEVIYETPTSGASGAGEAGAPGLNAGQPSLLTFATGGVGLTIQENTITGASARGMYLYASTTASPALPPTTPVTANLTNNMVTASALAGVQLGLNSLIAPITRNSIFANGGIGIDLTTVTVSGTSATTTSTGVTLNNGQDNNTGANGLLNFPIISTAAVSGSNLVVSGFARPNVLIEFFIADNDPSGFGEGQTFLFSRSVNNPDNLNPGTGSYSGTINGRDQGNDAAAQTYTFSIPLSQLSSAQLQALTAAQGLITATATRNGATSEFSGNAIVAGLATLNPIPNTVSNVPLAVNAGVTVLNPNLSATPGANNDPVAYFLITSLPTSGTLTYNGTVLTAANIATTQIVNTPASLNTLTYAPVSTFAGSSVSFTYEAVDTQGRVSTVSNNAGVLVPGDAIYTIPLVPIADVTTTLTAGPGQTQFLPGGTNSFTVTFRNAGPSAAADATYTVTVPPGFTVVAASLPTGATVSGNVITFPSADPQPSSAGSTSFTFSLTAPTPPAQTSYTLTSNAATSTSQGANVLPDQAQLTLNVIGPNVGCTASAYRVRQPTGGSFSLFERLDRSTVNGQITLTPVTLYNLNAGGVNVTLNALSYNALDGYFYAFGVSNNVLYRLGADSYQNLGAVVGFGQANSAGADAVGTINAIDDNTNTLYRLVIASRAVTTVSLSQTVRVGDLAVSPVNGFIYGTRFYAPLGSNGLYQINPQTGEVVALPGVGAIPLSGEDMGSMFFDAANTLYGVTNQGTTLIYDLTTGGTTVIGTAGTASQADGASCANPPQRLDAVLTASPQATRVSPTALDITFTVQVGNQTPTAVTAPNVQLDHFLSRDLTAGNPVITISRAPIISGSSALVLNAGFNGTSDPSLLSGNVALQPGQQATITYRVLFTYPSAAAVPAGTQFTQVLASSTSGGNANAGYSVVSNALVPPALVLAVDRSTNAASLPATANGDTPSLTPVSFASPLPVSLTVFAARAAGPDAELSWTTASETNNQGFDVERSFDGAAFAKIGQVAGQGSKLTPTDYRFLDAGVAARAAGSPVYYRLRQVDFDGTATYSPTRAVNFGAGAAPGLGFYPNPTGGPATLDLGQLAAGSYEVSLTDVAGRQVGQLRAPGGQLTPLDLRGLAPGSYQLHLRGTGSDGRPLNLHYRFTRE